MERFFLECVYTSRFLETGKMMEEYRKGTKLIQIEKGPVGYSYLIRKNQIAGGARGERNSCGSMLGGVRDSQYTEERRVLLPDSKLPEIKKRLKDKKYTKVTSGGMTLPKGTIVCPVRKNAHKPVRRTGGAKRKPETPAKSTGKSPAPRTTYKKGADTIEIIFMPPDKYVVHSTLKMNPKSIETIYEKIKSEKWSVEKPKPSKIQQYLDKSVISAINDKDTAAVVELLASGADPNLVISKGKKKILTPLHQAVRVGSAEITAALLNMGANPNVAVGEMETTPLMNAVWFSDKKTAKKMFEIAKLLISRGAKMDAKNAKGHTVIDAIKRKSAADKIKEFDKLL